MCKSVLIYANTKYDLPSADFHEYHKSITVLCTSLIEHHKSSTALCTLTSRKSIKQWC